MSHDYCNSSIDKLELIDSSPDRKLTKRDSCDSMHKTSLSGTFLVYSEDDTDESARFREMTAVAANANYRAGVGNDAYAGGVIDGNIINLSTPPNMVLEAHSAASVVAPISVLTKQKFNGSVDPEALVTIFLAANAVTTALEPIVLACLGLRCTIVFGAFLLMLRNIIKSGGIPGLTNTAVEGEQRWRIYSGFLLVGISQPLYQCTPALLSSSWFADKERTLAAGVALNAKPSWNRFIIYHWNYYGGFR